MKDYSKMSLVEHLHSTVVLLKDNKKGKGPHHCRNLHSTVVLLKVPAINRSNFVIIIYILL